MNHEEKTVKEVARSHDHKTVTFRNSVGWFAKIEMYVLAKQPDYPVRQNCSNFLINGAIHKSFRI